MWVKDGCADNSCHVHYQSWQYRYTTTTRDDNISTHDDIQRLSSAHDNEAYGDATQRRMTTEDDHYAT